FIPGSIVRIQLKNFLTYDYVEFRPGPYLNMIFGPNGTGKSSIACAICLGLNFPPSVLGRAQDLKSFVKNDKQEGHIEIELKGAKGKANLVILRKLSSNSKSAPFFLNGKSASGKEINARMAELNVQVSNLCTFLPQDRVAEFARMTPQQLLRETQRAAGNENLTAWHDTLISSGKELKQIQEVRLLHGAIVTRMLSHPVARKYRPRAPQDDGGAQC
ncbi:P-loop containing nucleoside triphosphate hydrolase protein, partial [Earliella scabrosa]